MKKQFYHTIIEIESIHMELDLMDMNEEEKKHIKSLIDSSVHHSIIDAVLSELSLEDKKLFLTHFLDDDHEKIWSFVKEKADNIEDKIKNTVSDLKKNILEDILSSKSASGK